ncbi:hypothetical protein [uncultured Roseovarius sp.]|uniref:hypothetical protein n=1 Tax=Roseovarius sp. TaxID=1486281 RepID=UPI0025E0F56F|nr:hypothetical protein [uncultured Roseovarius sp.]
MADPYPVWAPPFTKTERDVTNLANIPDPVGIPSPEAQAREGASCQNSVRMKPARPNSDAGKDHGPIITASGKTTKHIWADTLMVSSVNEGVSKGNA